MKIFGKVSIISRNCNRNRKRKNNWKYQIKRKNYSNASFIFFIGIEVVVSVFIIQNTQILKILHVHWRQMGMNSIHP